MKSSAEMTVMTKLILEIFHLNGPLLSEGDRLTKPFGLTSARWQVLGAIQLAATSTVASISRRMGLTRQAVQRVANDLEKLGFLSFEENPDHVRAKLLVLSQKGQQALDDIEQVQNDWARHLSENIDEAELQAALKLLQDLPLSLQER